LFDSQDYGCLGLCITGSVTAVTEVVRVDASFSTFFLVHSSLPMLTIGNNKSLNGNHFAHSIPIVPKTLHLWLTIKHIIIFII